MDLDMYQRCVQYTKGEVPAQIVFKNAKIVNVFTGEIIAGDIAIAEGIIVGIGEYEGLVEKDMTGKYICPGFIDAHLHLESTLLTPAELVAAASRCGTTTFIADPHESANVSGLAGIDYILQQTKDCQANVYVMMPSCVPATSIDDNGCAITAREMEPYLQNERILSLGEVMDYVSVVGSDPEMHRKLHLFENRIRDGHAPELSERDLEAYAMAGIETEHEASTFAYAMRERRNGMTILIREGSAARNVEEIVKGIVENQISTEGFCFCTDDKHIEDILREGHIDHNVRKAIGLGLDPVTAIQMATIHPAKCYGLKGIGAIAPGYQADLMVLSNLNTIQVDEVYYKGEKIQKSEPIKKAHCPKELKNTVHIKNFSKDRFCLPLTAETHVIELVEGQILTKDKKIKTEAGTNFRADEQYQKIAVVERHKSTGKVGVGVVSGYGIRQGAIASSVSHDSHNIIVVGDNDEDMELAVKELVTSQGGYCVVSDHKVFDTLPLPIMGLMSDAGFFEVHSKLQRMIQKAREMGVAEGIDPFITLSFMALTVIPEIRITPRGVYSVKENKFLNGN